MSKQFAYATSNHHGDKEWRIQLPDVQHIELRDLFAAFALVGLIQTDFARSVSHPDAASADAYRFADAMMVQRSKES